MKKIAIVGSSHVGAWRSGWDNVQDQLGKTFAPTFFACPLPAFGFLELGEDGIFGFPAKLDGKFETARSFMQKLIGAESIDLTEFDHVVYVGLRHSMTIIPTTLKKSDVDGICDNGRQNVMSYNAFHSALKASFAPCLPAKHWTAMKKGKLVVVQRASLAESAITLRRSFEGLGNPDSGLKAGMALFQDCMSDAVEEAGYQFLPQPVETISEETGLTLDRFSAGSSKLMGDDEHQADDLTHMNAEYGALCWRDLAKLLK